MKRTQRASNPTEFQVPTQLTALFVQFSISENVVKLTCGNVETHKCSEGNTSGTPRKGEDRGWEMKERARERERERGGKA